MTRFTAVTAHQIDSRIEPTTLRSKCKHHNPLGHGSTPQIVYNFKLYVTHAYNSSLMRHMLYYMPIIEAPYEVIIQCLSDWC